MKEFNYKDLENQYLMIDQPAFFEQPACVTVFKIGSIDENNHNAAYTIELLDYSTSNGSNPWSPVIKNYTYLGYAAARRAQIITEQQFYDHMIKNMIGHIRNVNANEAYALWFTPTQERIALLKYLSVNFKSVLAVV